jgi:hypothetical protein
MKTTTLLNYKELFNIHMHDLVCEALSTFVKNPDPNRAILLTFSALDHTNSEDVITLLQDAQKRNQLNDITIVLNDDNFQLVSISKEYIVLNLEFADYGIKALSIKLDWITKFQDTLDNIFIELQEKAPTFEYKRYITAFC